MDLFIKNKIKKTIPRLVVVETIEKKGHISIEELYAEIKEKYPSISLATIYKNVEFLIEKNILKKVLFKEKKEMFETVKEEHYHILNEGKLIDIFYSEETLDMLRNILNIDKSKKIDLTIY